MYLNRIHTATFLPFIAYNTDNQLITDTVACFNSIKVRLIHLLYPLVVMEETRFNSIKVRLILRTSIADRCKCYCFNSIKVRLILLLVLHVITSLPSFNSIKVRLIHHARAKIKTCAWFQFHKGSINTLCLMILHERQSSSNSIKVRLIRLLSKAKSLALMVSIP